MIRRLRLSLIGVAVLVSVATTAPQPLLAQSCGWCALGACSDGEHAIWGGMSILEPYHAACWLGSGYGSCLGHWACGGSPNEEEVDQLEQVVEAIAAEEVDRLRTGRL